MMQEHGNLTASYLWQPAEFARRMLGERPSPVPPTRNFWPPLQQPLSISTLHVAYLQDEPIRVPRRSVTLPPQTYVSTPALDHEVHEYITSAPIRPRVCTVGTNTEPPPTVYSRISRLFKRQEEDIIIRPTPQPPTGKLTAVPRETTFDLKEDENRARKTLNDIKKAISGAKYRIAPGNEAVDSPKIVYDQPKPGNRMTTTFGASERHRWCRVPSRAACSRRLRALGGWCGPRPRRPPRRQPQLPRLQITQV